MSSNRVEAPQIFESREALVGRDLTDLDLYARRLVARQAAERERRRWREAGDRAAAAGLGPPKFRDQQALERGTAAVLSGGGTLRLGEYSDASASAWSGWTAQGQGGAGSSGDGPLLGDGTGGTRQPGARSKEALETVRDARRARAMERGELPEDPAHDKDEGELDGGTGRTAVSGASHGGAGAAAGAGVVGMSTSLSSKSVHEASRRHGSSGRQAGDEEDERGLEAGAGLDMVAGSTRERGGERGKEDESRERDHRRTVSVDSTAAEESAVAAAVAAAGGGVGVGRNYGQVHIGPDPPAGLTPGVLAAEEELLAATTAPGAGVLSGVGARHSRRGRAGGKHARKTSGIHSPRARGARGAASTRLPQAGGGGPSGIGDTRAEDALVTPDMRLGELSSDLHARRHVLSQLVAKGQWFGPMPSRRVWGDEALENKAAERGASALTSVASRVRRRMRLQGLRQGAAMRLRTREPSALQSARHATASSSTSPSRQRGGGKDGVKGDPGPLEGGRGSLMDALPREQRRRLFAAAAKAMGGGYEGVPQGGAGGTWGLRARELEEAQEGQGKGAARGAGFGRAARPTAQAAAAVLGPRRAEGKGAAHGGAAVPGRFPQGRENALSRAGGRVSRSGVHTPFLRYGPSVGGLDEGEGEGGGPGEGGHGGDDVHVHVHREGEAGRDSRGSMGNTMGNTTGRAGAGSRLAMMWRSSKSRVAVGVAGESSSSRSGLQSRLGGGGSGPSTAAHDDDADPSGVSRLLEGVLDKSDRNALAAALDRALHAELDRGGNYVPPALPKGTQGTDGQRGGLIGSTSTPSLGAASLGASSSAGRLPGQQRVRGGRGAHGGFGLAAAEEARELKEAVDTVHRLTEGARTDGLPASGRRSALLSGQSSLALSAVDMLTSRASSRRRRAYGHGRVSAAAGGRGSRATGTAPETADSGAAVGSAGGRGSTGRTSGGFGGLLASRMGGQGRRGHGRPPMDKRSSRRFKTDIASMIALGLVPPQDAGDGLVALQGPRPGVVDSLRKEQKEAARAVRLLGASTSFVSPLGTVVNTARRARQARLLELLYWFGIAGDGRLLSKEELRERRRLIRQGQLEEPSMPYRRADTISVAPRVFAPSGGAGVGKGPANGARNGLSQSTSKRASGSKRGSSAAAGDEGPGSGSSGGTRVPGLDLAALGATGFASTAASPPEQQIGSQTARLGQRSSLLGASTPGSIAGDASMSRRKARRRKTRVSPGRAARRAVAALATGRGAAIHSAAAALSQELSLSPRAAEYSAVLPSARSGAAHRRGGGQRSAASPGMSGSLSMSRSRVGAAASPGTVGSPGTVSGRLGGASGLLSARSVSGSSSMGGGPRAPRRRLRGGKGASALSLAIQESESRRLRMKTGSVGAAEAMRVQAATSMAAASVLEEEGEGDGGIDDGRGSGSGRGSEEGGTEQTHMDEEEELLLIGAGEGAGDQLDATVVPLSLMAEERAAAGGSASGAQDAGATLSYLARGEGQPGSKGNQLPGYLAKAACLGFLRGDEAEACAGPASSGASWVLGQADADAAAQAEASEGGREVHAIASRDGDQDTEGHTPDSRNERKHLARMELERMLLAGRAALAQATARSSHAAASLGPPGRISLALWLDGSGGQGALEGGNVSVGFAAVASDEPESPRVAWEGASALLAAALGRAADSAGQVLFGGIVGLVRGLGALQPQAYGQGQGQEQEHGQHGASARGLGSRGVGAAQGAGPLQQGSAMHRAAMEEGLVLGEGEGQRVLRPTEDSGRDAAGQELALGSSVGPSGEVGLMQPSLATLDSQELQGGDPVGFHDEAIAFASQPRLLMSPPPVRPDQDASTGGRVGADATPHRTGRGSVGFGPAPTPRSSYAAAAVAGLVATPRYLLALLVVCDLAIDRRGLAQLSPRNVYGPVALSSVAQAALQQLAIEARGASRAESGTAGEGEGEGEGKGKGDGEEEGERRGQLVSRGGGSRGAESSPQGTPGLLPPLVDLEALEQEALGGSPRGTRGLDGEGEGEREDPLLAFAFQALSGDIAEGGLGLKAGDAALTDADEASDAAAAMERAFRAAIQRKPDVGEVGPDSDSDGGEEGGGQLGGAGAGNGGEHFRPPAAAAAEVRAKTARSVATTALHAATAGIGAAEAEAARREVRLYRMLGIVPRRQSVLVIGEAPSALQQLSGALTPANIAAAKHSSRGAAEAGARRTAVAGAGGAAGASGRRVSQVSQLSGLMPGRASQGGVAAALLGLPGGGRGLAGLLGQRGRSGSGAGPGERADRGAIDHAQLPGMYAVLNRNRAKHGGGSSGQGTGKGTGAFALLNKEGIEAARAPGSAVQQSHTVTALTERGSRAARAQKRRTVNAHGATGKGKKGRRGSVLGGAQPGQREDADAAAIEASGGNASVALGRLVAAGGALEERAVQRRIDERGLPRRTPSPEPLLPYTTRKPAPEPNPLPTMEEVRQELDQQGSAAVGKMLRQHRSEVARANHAIEKSRRRITGAGADGEVLEGLYDEEHEDGQGLEQGSSIFGFGEEEEEGEGGGPHGLGEVDGGEGGASGRHAAVRLPSGRLVSGDGTLPPGQSLRELSVLDQQAVRALRDRVADEQFLAWMQLSGLAGDEGEARRMAGLETGPRRSHGQRGLLSHPSERDVGRALVPMGRESRLTQGTTGSMGTAGTDGTAGGGTRAAARHGVDGRGSAGSLPSRGGGGVGDGGESVGGGRRGGGLAGGRISRGRMLRVASARTKKDGAIGEAEAGVGQEIANRPRPPASKPAWNRAAGGGRSRAPTGTVPMGQPPPSGQGAGGPPSVTAATEDMIRRALWERAGEGASDGHDGHDHGEGEQGGQGEAGAAAARKKKGKRMGRGRGKGRFIAKTASEGLERLHPGLEGVNERDLGAGDRFELARVRADQRLGKTLDALAKGRADALWHRMGALSTVLGDGSSREQGSGLVALDLAQESLVMMRVQAEVGRLADAEAKRAGLGWFRHLLRVLVSQQAPGDVSPAQRLIVHRLAQALRISSTHGSKARIAASAHPRKLPLTLLGGLLDALEPQELVLPGVQLTLAFLRRAMAVPLRVWTAMHAARGQPPPCEAVLQRLYLEKERIAAEAARGASAGAMGKSSAGVAAVKDAAPVAGALPSARGQWGAQEDGWAARETGRRLLSLLGEQGPAIDLSPGKQGKRGSDGREGKIAAGFGFTGSSGRGAIAGHSLQASTSPIGGAASTKQPAEDLLHRTGSAAPRDIHSELRARQAILQGAASGEARAMAAKPPSPALLLQREFDAFYDALPKVPKILASPLKQRQAGAGNGGADDARPGPPPRPGINAVHAGAGTGTGGSSRDSPPVPARRQGILDKLGPEDRALLPRALREELDGTVLRRVKEEIGLGGHLLGEEVQDREGAGAS